MIQVTIPQLQWDETKHDTLAGRRFIETCREVGIPVIGNFAMAGVESGHLVMTSIPHNFDDVAYQFQWYAIGEVIPGSLKHTWKGYTKKGYAVLKTNQHALEEDEI